MSHYGKIFSGSGVHGVKYEINLLLYTLLKVYESDENFQLSNGDKDNLKLDDIILKTETYKMYVQAKHAENDTKTITEKQLFGQQGKYSLCVYIKVAYEGSFQNFLHDILNRLRELAETRRKGDRAVEVLKITVKSLTNTEEQIHNFNEENFANFITDLRKLNDKKINELLFLLDNTFFYLVTNISPNKKCTNSETRSSDSKNVRNFEEIEEYYNFNTDQSVKELSKMVDIPSWFINIFLEKFYLVIVPDNNLHEIINSLFESLYPKLEIFQEINYRDLYELIENWQSAKNGTFLSRSEVDDAFFAYIISRNFKQQLKAREELVLVDVDPLSPNANPNFITIVETPRYLLNMAIVHKSLENQNLLQTLFVNPNSDSNIQKLVIRAFLHKKYTHLICALHKNATDLKYLVNDIVKKITENNKFLEYKKIVLLCNDSIQLNYTESRIITDDKCFEKCILTGQRMPNSLGNLENYYVRRQLLLNNTSIKVSEDAFIKDIMINNNDFIVISDSPGTGKTSLLLSLAVKINKEYNFWAHIIHLNSFTNLLYKHFKSKTVPHLNEFLDILVKDNFEKEICEITNILILMFDGFDEISPDYKDLVTDFLKNTALLKNVKTTIVTTREHTKNHLQNQLKGSIFSLRFLTGDDICNLICKFRKWDKTVVKKWFYSIPFSVGDFLKTPLHAKMFTELLSKLSIESPQTDFNLNFYELYDEFVRKKTDIYVEEKCNCQGNARSTSKHTKEFHNMLDICIEIALELTLKEETMKKIGILKSIGSIFIEDLCASGIIVLVHDTLRFVHKTFHEFFVAKWVVTTILDKNKCKPDIAQLIFEKIFINFRDGNRFIDSYLQKYWNLIPVEVSETFGAVLLHNENINLFLITCFYEYPFLFRLLVTMISDSKLLTMIFNQIFDANALESKKMSFSAFVEKNIKIDYEELTYLNTIANDLKPFRNKELTLDKVTNLLHSAVQRSQVTIVKYLVEKGVNINAKTKEGENVLHSAVRKNNIDLVKYLIEMGININEKINDDDNALHIAVYCNYKEIVEYLIKKGINVNEKTNKGENVLHIALHENYIELVEFLIENGIDINEKTNTGENVLHISVQKNNIELVKYLIEKEINVNEKTNEGRNVLHIAVQNNNVQLVKYLIQKGVYVNDTTNKCKNVLHIAARKNNIELVKYLIENGLNINEKTNENENVLHIAVTENDIEVVKYLIEEGVNINEKTVRGENVLHIAMRHNNLKLVKYLIEKGVKINEKTNEGENLLHIAVRKNNLDLVKYLIVKGVNLKEKTNKGESVLHIAVCWSCHEDYNELIKYLIDRGVDINEKTKEGENVLHIAVRKNNIKLVKYLIDKGVNINEKINEDENVLHIAVYFNYKKLVKYLLKNGVSINEKTIKGENVLHIAVFWNYGGDYNELINYLIDKGVNINDKTNTGENVLHIAVQRNYTELVEYLIEKGIDLNEKTNKGENALDIAFNGEHVELIHYLFAKGVNLTEKKVELARSI